MAWKLVNEIIVPAEYGRAWTVNAGQTMRIIAIDGGQCGDLAVFNAYNYRDTYAADFSWGWNHSMGTGNLFRLKYMYSRPPFCNLLMEITEDKVGENAVPMGHHCSRRSYELRGDPRLMERGNVRSCTDNIAEAIAPYGMKTEDVPQTFNFWMTVEYNTADGTHIIGPNKAQKGDRIDFLAHMDCLIALSSCPADRPDVPINSGSNKPLKAEIWEESN